jgi:hypothetical protein
MIEKALLLILSQLNQYIVPLAGGDEVVLGNVSLADAPDQNDLKDKVVVGVVNIEEENTLKNTINHVRQGTGQQFHQTPIYLNLYVLFCSHYPNSYETALNRLSSIIEFFQFRKSFSINSSQPIPAILNLAKPEDADLSVTLDLYTMTFEQLNHLWGSLGGKQMPSVLYKIRLVKIQANTMFREVPLIEEIQHNLVNPI